MHHHQPSPRARQVGIRVLWTWTTSWLLLATAVTHGQALPPIEISPGGPSYAPGEVLVQFGNAVSDAQIKSAFQQAGLGLLKHIQTPTMRDHGRFGLTRAATALPVPVAVQILSRLPGVEFAEPNWVAAHAGLANDPYYWDLTIPGPLWGMWGDDWPSPTGPLNTTTWFGCQAEKAWAGGFIGSHQVYIGIIDSGIQINHPDLAANIWTNPGEIPGNGVDDDGNGYVDDVHGWNAIEGNGNVLNVDDNDSHGTHVAGTIGAVGGNGIGVAGVNWDVTLIPGRCFNGPGYSSDIIEAIDYMTALKTRKGLNVVALNNSYGGSGFSQAGLEAIARAAQAGILFVASAGNAAQDNDVAPYYPSSYDTTGLAGYDAVVSVAAINREGNKSSFSSFGVTTVDLGAPGGERKDPNDGTVRDPDYEIVSTVPTSNYGHKRGTSMAAPHVTGAVALYASINPGASPLQARQDLLSAGVRPLAALEGITVAGGTLDIGALVKLEPMVLAAPSTPANVQASAISGGQVDVSWTDSSDNELGFAVERSTDGANYLLVDTIGADFTAYSDRTVLPGGTYYYRVLAFNPSGGSAHAFTPDSVTTPTVTLPAAPSNLTAKALSPGQGVSLSWKDNSHNEEGFRIERKTSSTGTWQLLTILGANLTKYTDGPAARRATYTYRVSSFNVAGNSSYSNEPTIKTK